MAEMNATLKEARHIGRFLRDEINRTDFETYHKERPRWTDAVKLAFAKYLINEGFQNKSEVLPPIDPNKIASRKDEFLVDFVLWRRDIDEMKVGEMKEGAWIACESEWDRDKDGILKDFDKLLSFRAPYKVMIYESKSKKDAAFGTSLRKSFQEQLANFNWNDGEAYIFIEFVHGRVADIYTCLPSENCTLLLAPESELKNIHQADSL